MRASFREAQLPPTRAAALDCPSPARKMALRFFTERDITMSLFSELFALTKSRRFAMIVSSNHDTGLMTISVMPRAQNEADGQYCKDLTLTATPEDFDTDFLAAISQYRGKIAPLLEQAKEAAAAIDKTAQSAKSVTTAKPTGKTATKLNSTPSAKASTESTSVEDKAKAYRDASSGDDEQEQEPTNDWMKNRQPELF